MPLPEIFTSASIPVLSLVATSLIAIVLIFVASVRSMVNFFVDSVHKQEERQRAHIDNMTKNYETIILRLEQVVRDCNEALTRNTVAFERLGDALHRLEK